MSMEDTYNVAARYRTVRKHLDNLGYKQALTLDALPLIEKLLADLIQTTESLKHFKSIAQENIEAHTELQSIIDPYKCDNVRLVQECNQLHLDLIKEKESHQKQIKDLKKEIYKLERECNDLQLVSSRNLHRIKDLETESSKKSKKILELQGKCLKPTISNVGLASKKRPVFPLRRPIIEGEPLPKTGTKSKNPLPNLSTVEPKVVDFLSMADHKMNCLSHEVTKLKGELSLQTENVHTLKSQLATKEKEIMRLKKMLDGGRPYSAVLKDCACKKADNFIMSKDNIGVNELKILQQEKLELEQQLKEALNKQHDAMSQALKLADRNEELEKELRDIDHIALAVEADCNSAVKENNKRVSKLQQKLEEVMTQVHVLESELIVERREVQELKADLEACRMEKNNIQHSLESALDDKKQMADRINELTVIERNLNEEIERLARENERQRQDVIQLQYSNKLLKDEMNMEESLQDNDMVNLRRKTNDDNKGQNEHETQKEREIQNENGIWYNNVLKQSNEKEAQLNNLQQTVEQLRRERDFYKDEYNKVKDYHNKTIDKDHVDLRTRIRELKLQLTEKENVVDELQREKKELCREKINLETRLQNYKSDHKTSCRPCNICKRGTSCNCSLSTVKDISKTKGIFEKLEHERDIARADVERLIEERDALRERLKRATEAHTSEQHRLRENLTEVEARLKQLEKERQELLLTQGARKATINGLEDQLQDLREELKRTKQELGTQRTQYFQLRALQDQTDQALADAQTQLTQSESELNKALDRNRSMERQRLQLENQLKELHQEINNLKGKMTHLDQEKDQLLMMLDEKTEKIAALEKEIMLKDQQVMGSKHQIHELQQKNEITVNQCAEQERKLRAMQMEVENLQRQLQTTTYDRENAIQENQRVQDDFAAVTCEVRNLQRELDTSRSECCDLKRQLQTYVGEVRRAEDLLNRKENERTEMLNHFRSLSLEATVLENNNHSLESEAAEARGALQSTRDRLLDLERQLADKDSLIRGYETQINELTQNVASMETQLRQQGEQRHRAEADLNAVRGLCVKLDQHKDALMHQLDDKDALKAQYDMQISKLKAEQAVIQDQMSRDRATVERLEMLLDKARQESITVQANNQELKNEMCRLKQKMSELQGKLSSESGKLRQYQTQAAEYCKQISELRRQVTNERFDRARKEEENRRHSEGLPDSPTVQTPLPNNQIPNESTDTGFATRRSLNSTPDSFNNERNEEHDGTTDGSRMKTIDDFSMSRFGHLNVENNCRYGGRPKENQRDVPCINIILRSDCKMHSNQYNYVQKENAQNENRLVPENKEDLIRTDVQMSNVSGLDSSDKKYDSICFNTGNRFDLLQTLGMKYETRLGSSSMLQFNSSNKKYNHTAIDIENNFNVSQSVGVQNRAQYNQATEQSACDNASQIQYTGRSISCYPVCCSTKISNDGETLDNTAKKKVNFSTIHNIVSENDKIKTGCNVNKFNIENSMKSCKEVFWKSFPETRLEKNMEKGNEEKVSTMKSDLSDLRKIEEGFKYVPKPNVMPALQDSTVLEETDLNLKSINSKCKKIQSSLNATDYKGSVCVNSYATSYISRNSIDNDKIENTICTNKTNNISKNNYESYILPEESICNKLTSRMNQLTYLSAENDTNVCTNTTCTKNNYSASSTKGENNHKSTYTDMKCTNDVTTNTLWESAENFYCNNERAKKYISTIDTALGMLQDTLKGVKKFENKGTVEQIPQDYHCEEVRCKNMNCNYLNAPYEVTISGHKYNYTKSPELLRPECMKMLQEIKEHTKTLEEQLTIMNKSMKIMKRIVERAMPTSECNMELKTYKQEIHSIKLKRDIITQNPEKRNTYVQEPSRDINYVNNVQDTVVKLGKGCCNQRVVVQQINKRNKSEREVEQKCFAEQESKDHKRDDSNIRSVINAREPTGCKLLKHHDTNNFKRTQNVRIQCMRSCHIIAPVSCKSLSTSAPEKLDASNKHCVVGKENSRTQRINKTVLLDKLITDSIEMINKGTDLTDINDQQESLTCEERAIMMLLLAKSVSNKCLKCKRKRSEFINFRPKCIIDSCISCDRRLVKCKLSKGRMQIPVVFKQSKPITCKGKRNIYSNQNSCACFINESGNDNQSSNLMTAVYTQSSNLRITTATSVSCSSISNESIVEDVAEERRTLRDACILS